MTADIRQRALRAILATALLSFVPATAAGASEAELRRGESVYARCLACHALKRDMVGPRHCGVFGRRAGSLAGYDYSPAMRSSGLVWNDRTLDRFLRDPMKAVPGTSMTYSGVPDDDERAALIAWLKQANASAACARSAPARGRR